MILSCFASSPSLLLKPLRDGWTDFLQEPSIPEISLRNPLSKGTVNHQRWPSSLKKSVTSSRKETKHYTKLGKGKRKRVRFRDLISKEVASGKKEPSTDVVFVLSSNLKIGFLYEETGIRGETRLFYRRLQEVNSWQLSTRE
ncbi:hypothetical protein Tco_0985340 [Tanacetum coccineum]